MEKIVGEGQGFERIRRVTGYLAGDVSRFNNGKRAEEILEFLCLSDKKDNYDRIDYGEPEYTLTILKDGKRAIICQIKIDAVTVMGFNEGHMGELLEMVIPVE